MIHVLDAWAMRAHLRGEPGGFRRASLPLVCLLGLAAGCARAPEPEPEPTGPPPVPVPGAVPVPAEARMRWPAQEDCATRPTRSVARSARDWSRVWKEVSDCPVPEMPVDFGRDMLLVVTNGWATTGMASVRVDSVARRGDTLVAVVSNYNPSGIVTTDMGNPQDYVRLPRAAVVRFVERSSSNAEEAEKDYEQMRWENSVTEALWLATVGGPMLLLGLLPALAFRRTRATVLLLLKWGAAGALLGAAAGVPAGRTEAAEMVVFGDLIWLPLTSIGFGVGAAGGAVRAWLRRGERRDARSRG